MFKNKEIMITKIKRLLYWLPVIWKDKDWDYSFFYDIIEHKLNSMAKHFEEDDYCIDSLRDSEWQKTAAKLCNRLSTEYYFEQSGYKSYKKQNKARKLLFKLLEEKIEGWWI